MTRSAAYTTHAKVSSLLQCGTFGESTEPTSSEVETFIMRAEDKIEQETRKAWRAVTVTDEYHDYWGVVRTPLWYKYNLSVWGASWVKAKHRPLQTFTSSTHKIELWDGSDWVDLVLAANSYTEGRGDDYYIDYDQGKIYFVDMKPLVGRNTVRLTYDYGHSSVGLDIEEAATKLAAIEVINSTDKTVLIAEGGQYAPLPVQRIQGWKEDIKQILARHREVPGVYR